MHRQVALSILILVSACFTARAAEFSIRNEAEFRKAVPADSKLQKLGSGFKFVEGPVWTSAGGGYVVFSDIPSDQIKKWSTQGGVATFREPSHASNGNARDPQGRLVTCEHGSRSVTRTELDGSVITLADRYNGKKLNSPNDVAVKSDGTIWFTDPPYGIGREAKEQPGNYVYRIDPAGKRITVVATDFDMPNGICFSPDEKKLYVADSGKPHHIRVFDVKEDGTLQGGSVFCTIDPGVPDGIRCDAEGRIWSSAADGVHIFSPDGSLIGKILVPESPANLCFGGEDGKTLFITARTSLYAIRVGVRGAGVGGRAQESAGR